MVCAGKLWSCRLFMLGGLLLLAVQPLHAAWSDILYDTFDDGNFDGWTVGSVGAPDIVSSPNGFALVGVGTGYYPEPVARTIYQDVSWSIPGALKIEMRVDTGPIWPSFAVITLYSSSGPQDVYRTMAWGEANKFAELNVVDDGVTDYYVHPIGEEAYNWHTYTWTRDSAGTWSLSFDDVVVAPNLAQDDRFTSFDRVELQLNRNEAFVEYVRISVPEPATLCLLAMGCLGLIRRWRG